MFDFRCFCALFALPLTSLFQNGRIFLLLFFFAGALHLELLACVCKFSSCHLVPISCSIEICFCLWRKSPFSNFRNGFKIFKNVFFFSSVTYANPFENLCFSFYYIHHAHSFLIFYTWKNSFGQHVVIFILLSAINAFKLF